MQNNKNTVFNLTKKLIENNEGRVLKYTSDQIINISFINSILTLPRRYLLYPIKYLLLGAEDLFKPMLIWAIISFLFFMSFSLFIPYFNSLPKSLVAFISSLVFLIPIFLVMFSVPSTYAFYGLTNKEIQALTNELNSLGINKIETVEGIEANLEKIYMRVMSKYNAYKWIIGTIWFISILIITIKMRIGLKLSDIAWIKLLQESFSTLSFLIIFTMLSIFIITSYKRASDILFKSIEFSLIELKHKLELEKNETTNN